MALDNPLNQRQLDVLNWINDGCPDGRWTDYTFKTTAQSLASRRLVTVSKRGGTWKAAILPAGAHYLATGAYPASHWTRPRRTASERVQQVKTWAAPSQPVTPVPRLPKKAIGASSEDGGLTPTRQLVQDIVAAGGVLEVDTSDDNRSFTSLVGIINRRGMAPDGQEVILTRARHNRVIMRLSAVSDWKTDQPSKTLAAERIGRWHPMIAALRKEGWLDSIGRDLRPKALRLLHAIAREAEARGYKVRVSERNRHGYLEDRTRLTGDLIIVMPEIECSVKIAQPTDRVPHTPTADELERQRKYNNWPPPQHDYVPANRLNMTIDTNSRYASKITWKETKTLKLEQRLPDVFITFERWAVVHAEETEAARLAEIAKRKRQEQEDELARDAYVQDALGQRLLVDMQAWKTAAKLREYLGALAERVERIGDPEERTAAEEWLDWCRKYALEQDPLGRPIRKPRVKPPGYSELQEFRSRLGFGSHYW